MRQMSSSVIKCATLEWLAGGVGRAGFACLGRLSSESSSCLSQGFRWSSVNQFGPAQCWRWIIRMWFMINNPWRIKSALESREAQSTSPGESCKDLYRLVPSCADRTSGKNSEPQNKQYWSSGVSTYFIKNRRPMYWQPLCFLSVPSMCVPK